MSKQTTVRGIRLIQALALGAVLIVGIGFASRVQADSGPKGMGGSRYEHRGVSPNFVGHALNGLLRSQKELGLSQEQGDKIKAISTGYAKERIQGEADIKLAELDVRANILDEQVELGTIEAALKKSESARTALRLEGVKALREASAVLNPEQREKWRQKMAAHGGSGKRGYGHGPGSDSHARPGRGG
jgi:periplasmic protein CpxP/Spy